MRKTTSSASTPTKWLARAGAVVLALACQPAWGQAPQTSQSSQDALTQMSIENLLHMKVTSASKKEESVSKTAAAIYVITQEDIRRSGLTSVPELLRMVPGLDVAQVDASTWAVSSRGFNDRFAWRLLVLIDGRAVFTPTFSGVYWDIQDLVLEDIDRIEVIRGPGATLWGANAVNGVINIITKKASDTQRGLVSVTAGNQDRSAVTARYGGTAGSKGHYRVFAKYFDRDSFARLAGSDGNDAWNLQHGGFRTDWDLSAKDSLTVQGDIYNGRENHTGTGVLSLSPLVAGSFRETTGVAGGDLLGRWHHTFSRRPARKAAASGENGDTPWAIKSALMKFLQSA